MTLTVTQNPPMTPAASGWSRLPAAYAIPATAPTLPEAREYCARLARSHYENFSVASWFLPRRLRQHFFNVYAYCRISDDLGDEVGDTSASLELLDQWQQELDACYDGTPKHPVFVALAETVRQFDIPKHEFSDLLIAFRQDQTITRFETFDDVLAYCHYSANPVGHLVLYLCGYRDPERQQISDFTCTALQLANFWQDVSVDYAKGRIYLPLESLRRFGVSEEDIARNQNTPAFRAMMKFEVERAQGWFRQGLPLISKVDRALAIDLDLFSRGGQEILRAIERQGYAVLGNRPSISKPRKLALVARAAIGKLFSNFSSADSRGSTRIGQVTIEQTRDRDDKGLSA
jgi:squalene synthase HpnC